MVTASVKSIVIFTHKYVSGDILLRQTRVELGIFGRGAFVTFQSESFTGAVLYPATHANSIILAIFLYFVDLFYAAYTVLQRS